MEHPPAKSGKAITRKSATPCQPATSDYWYALINEEEAAKFAHLSVRTMQGFRYRGGSARTTGVIDRSTEFLIIGLSNSVQIRTSSLAKGFQLETV